MRKVISSSRKSPQKTIEISNFNTRQEITQQIKYRNTELAQGSKEVQPRFIRMSNKYEVLRNQNKNYKEHLIFNLLEKLFNRRNSYSFQMIKLLYLFPDDTFSENISINSYDKLFYKDQNIHTLVKIYQTKEAQRKIWAFLNLKNLHKKKKLQKFTLKINQVKQKLTHRIKKQSFSTLNLYSIKILGEKQKVQVKYDQLKSDQIKTKICVDQTIKTEKIERTNITSKNTDNETNRKLQYNQNRTQPPPVERIYLTSDDIKRIYPGSVAQGLKTYRIYENNSKQEEKNLTQKITVKRYQSTEDFNNSKTKIINEKRNISIERPSIQSTRTAENFRKIQPVQIISTPGYYPKSLSTPIHYQKQRTREVSADGHGLLVHTVEGNCTINIHNGCGGSQSSNIKSKHHQFVNSRSCMATRCNNYCNNVHSCQSSHYCCSCSCSICNHCPSMRMSHHHHTCPCESRTHSSRGSNSMNYNLEQRIKYLQKLQELNHKMEFGKRFYKE